MCDLTVERLSGFYFLNLPEAPRDAKDIVCFHLKSELLKYKTQNYKRIRGYFLRKLFFNTKSSNLFLNIRIMKAIFKVVTI